MDNGGFSGTWAAWWWAWVQAWTEGTWLGPASAGAVLWWFAAAASLLNSHLFQEPKGYHHRVLRVGTVRAGHTCDQRATGVRCGS
ncbi:MAG: hypothetical protein K0R62_4864 [Nonomuraea muscovyensis]|nr:hypothetical protein [Nonomuraea muscovyensis]